MRGQHWGYRGEGDPAPTRKTVTKAVTIRLPKGLHAHATRQANLAGQPVTAWLAAWVTERLGDERG